MSTGNNLTRIEIRLLIHSGSIYNISNLLHLNFQYLRIKNRYTADNFVALIAKDFSLGLMPVESMRPKFYDCHRV
jgi:hypothetical protein